MDTYIHDLKKRAHALPHSEVQGFLGSFLDLREMVYAMLRDIPEEKLDYKPNTEPETADLRECFAELIRVEASLVKGLETGKRQMGGGRDAISKKPTKEELLRAFHDIDMKLFAIITDKNFLPDKEIPWINNDGTVRSQWKAMWHLWGLRNHENLHLGMIRRDIDAIKVKPPTEYTRYWYG